MPGETIADTLLSGFFVRRQQGARIYFVRKHAHGRHHFIAIGEHGREGWTEAKARTAALDIIVAIRHGRDPAAERTELKTMPLLADFAAGVVAQRAAVLKPSSITNYRITLDKHIAPRDARGILRPGCLGAMRMDSVTRQHVTVLHRAMRATPRAANYVLDLLNVVYREAHAAGLLAEGHNPARRVQRYKIHARQRFLDEDELARLGAALAHGALTGEFLAEHGTTAADHARAVMTAVEAHFPALAPYWSTGVGLRLQNLDADICARVQRKLRQRGIPCLSVHDSFVAPASEGLALQVVMDEAFDDACERLRSEARHAST